MICLTATQKSPAEAATAIEANRPWIDMVELRLDFWNLQDPKLFEDELPRDLPRIVTLRRVSDGGRFALSETKRADLLTVALERLRPEYVDLEDDFCNTREGSELLAFARSLGCRIVRSVHDFEGTPEELADRIRRLDAAEGDVTKYAVTTASTADLLTLHRAAEAVFRAEPGRERVLLGMGTYGVPSRLLPSRFHAAWTYCSAPDPGTTPGAPGHLSPRELIERFAHREAEAGEPLFAILGDPVLHSGSPSYHNRRFREKGAPGAYIAFPADLLDPTMELLDRLGFRGLSVTIPHKEGVIPFLERAEESVRAMGACNTLLRSSAGGWRGLNTDVPGFLGPLKRELPELRALRALVIGAGGAARAVVFALLQEGVELTVANRTRMRGEALIEELLAGGGGAGGAGVAPRALSLNDPVLPRTPFDLIVQTTSVGMDGLSEPLPELPIGPGQLVYDIIYTPPETPLILRARAAGARTIAGGRMFEAQAAAQFDEFLRLARESA
ncbi:MAG: type I 3-dehydroquinate dehydratase [Spirochaetaceae bacterium]